MVLDAPSVPGKSANTFRLRGNLVSKGFDATYTAGFRDGHTNSGTVAVRCAANRPAPEPGHDGLLTSRVNPPAVRDEGNPIGGDVRRP